MKRIFGRLLAKILLGLLAAANATFLLVPTFVDLEQIKSLNLVEKDMGILTNALDAYRNDKGGYPARQGALEDGYVEMLPFQPFVRSSFFHYVYHRVEDGKGFLFVAPGPDCDIESGQVLPYAPRNGIVSDGDIYWTEEGRATGPGWEDHVEAAPWTSQ